MNRQTILSMLLTSAAIVILACQGQAPVESPVQSSSNAASAAFIYADGEQNGTATLLQVDEGVQLDVNLKGLDPGTYSSQATSNNSCAAPHLIYEGDTRPTNLGSMQVNADGEADVDWTVKNLSLSSGGDHRLLNKPIVVASADGSGARVACGAIESDG